MVLNSQFAILDWAKSQIGKTASGYALTSSWNNPAWF
jgi:hypothetical protein